MKEGDDVLEGHDVRHPRVDEDGDARRGPRRGKVEKIACAEGQAVNEGDVLVVLV